MQLTRFRVVILLILAVTSSSVLVWHFTAGTPSGTNIVVTPSQAGPCSWFVYLEGTTPFARALVAGLAVSVGDNLAGTAGQDMALFLATPVANVVALGGGSLCFTGGIYKFATGLTIKGHQIYFIDVNGYGRVKGDNNQANNPAPNPVYFNATAAMACILCWGDTVSGVFWHGGGIEDIQVNGNGLATDCIDDNNVHDMRILDSLVENCIGWQFHAFSNIAGGISNIRIDKDLFRFQGISSGTLNGVFMDARVGQSWITNNFFSGMKGKGIALTGTNNGNQNHIDGNHFESITAGSGGGFHDGDAIYDLEAEEDISGNDFLNIAYNCIDISGTTLWTITGNKCFEPNQAANNDGACFAFGSFNNNPSIVTMTGNSCYDDNSHVVYGIYLNLLSSSNSFSIVGNSFFGAFQGPRLKGVSTVTGANFTVWNNAGMDPIGKVTNFVDGTIFAPWGTSSTVVASTTYTINGNDVLLTSTGGTGVSINIGCGGSNYVSAAATVTNQVVWAACTVNFGAFSIAPTVTIFAK